MSTRIKSKSGDRNLRTGPGQKGKAAWILHGTKYLCCGVLCCLILAGCTMVSREKVKLKDLEFTVLGEEMIPEELKSIIDEKKKEPFSLTYADREHLYICIGYGEQETGGYSIAVEELYLTEDAAYVDTTLLGPEASEKQNKTPSYPYIVIKTNQLEVPVIFQ